ncbi:unnamed protein product [Lactuca saligna]|uniref:Uncharacterized protein n=1 Tax=Lactuca saligna TaxID=75948 RepID=A0AA35V5G3_LACSI|nr:unnamed protein product [Lactuca saligna]
MESKVMDALFMKIEKVKVLGIKLENVEKKVKDLLSEKHLSEKLCPVFAMLHRLEGVSPQSCDPKQGGQGILKESPKAPVNPIVKKEPKGKEKMKDEGPIIDNDEDEEPDEAEFKRQEAFASFDIQNTQTSQLDLPITLIVFRFHAFLNVSDAPITDSGVDHMLFSFYLKYMKPQYKTWYPNKINAVKVTGPIETDSFPNAKFKVARGLDSQVYKFTLADLPYLNPYD